MNAQLKPVQLAITPAEYDNTMLGWFEDWQRDNVDQLRERASDPALGEMLPEQDFELFAKAQHDMQLAIRDEFKQTLRQY